MENPHSEGMAVDIQNCSCLLLMSPCRWRYFLLLSLPQGLALLADVEETDDRC